MKGSCPVTRALPSASPDIFLGHRRREPSWRGWRRLAHADGAHPPTM